MGAWCGHCRDIDIYIYNTEGDDQWSTFTSVDGFLLLYSPENLGIFQAEPGTKNTLPNLWGLRHIHGTELHAHTHTPTHIYTHTDMYIYTLLLLLLLLLSSSHHHYYYGYVHYQYDDYYIIIIHYHVFSYHYYSLSCHQFFPLSFPTELHRSSTGLVLLTATSRGTSGSSFNKLAREAAAACTCQVRWGNPKVNCGKWMNMDHLDPFMDI